MEGGREVQREVARESPNDGGVVGHPANSEGDGNRGGGQG